MKRLLAVLLAVVLVGLGCESDSKKDDGLEPVLDTSGQAVKNDRGETLFVDEDGTIGAESDFSAASNPQEGDVRREYTYHENGGSWREYVYRDGQWVRTGQAGGWSNYDGGGVTTTGGGSYDSTGGSGPSSGAGSGGSSGGNVVDPGEQLDDFN